MLGRAWVGIVGTAVGALVGGGAVILGEHSRRRVEAEAHLRAQVHRDRLEAYREASGYFERAEAAASRANLLLGISEDHGDFEPAHDDLRAILVDVERTVGALEPTASVDALQAAQQVVRALESLATALLIERMADQDKTMTVDRRGLRTHTAETFATVRASRSNYRALMHRDLATT